MVIILGIMERGRKPRIIYSIDGGASDVTENTEPRAIYLKRSYVSTPSGRFLFLMKVAFGVNVNAKCDRASPDLTTR